MKNSLQIPALKSPVRVDWSDSVSQPGWHYVSPEEEPDFSLRLPMQTRGILVAIYEDSLAIAATVAPRGPSDKKEGYMDVLTVPLGCIRDIQVTQ